MMITCVARPCVFYRQGTCPKGDRCNYIHEPTMGSSSPNMDDLSPVSSSSPTPTLVTAEVVTSRIDLKLLNGDSMEEDEKTGDRWEDTVESGLFELDDDDDQVVYQRACAPFALFGALF